MKRLQLNQQLKVRTSPTGTSLAFIPGRNFVYELNETASAILDALQQPRSEDELTSHLSENFQFDDPIAFSEEVRSVLERFVEHTIVQIKELP